MSILEEDLRRISKDFLVTAMIHADEIVKLRDQCEEELARRKNNTPSGMAVPNGAQ